MHTLSRLGFHLLLAVIVALFFKNNFFKSVKMQKQSAAAVASDQSPSTDLSPEDFRIYNRLAEQMIMYHSILRANWDELYAGTVPGVQKPSTSRLVGIGLQFCHHLKGHHDIEETYWFPILGRKMEGFRPGHFAKEQHREMHKGLDVLMPYLESCRQGKTELRREEVRRIMDTFGGILWQHMDEEVQELGAANMKKYWTKQEIQRFPF